MKTLKKYFRNPRAQSLLEYTLLFGVSIIAVLVVGGLITRAQARGGRVRINSRWVETGLHGYFNTAKDWILGNRP